MNQNKEFIECYGQEEFDDFLIISLENLGFKGGELWHPAQLQMKRVLFALTLINVRLTKYGELTEGLD